MCTYVSQSYVMLLFFLFLLLMHGSLSEFMAKKGGVSVYLCSSIVYFCWCVLLLFSNFFGMMPVKLFLEVGICICWFDSRNFWWMSDDEMCQMMLKHLFFYASEVFLEFSRSSFPALKIFLVLVCMHVFRGSIRIMCQ